MTSVNLEGTDAWCQAALYLIALAFPLQGMGTVQMHDGVCCAD